MELLRDSHGELLRARTFSATSIHTPRPDNKWRTLCGARVILLSEHACEIWHRDKKPCGDGPHQNDLTVCAGDDPQLCKRCQASVARIEREASRLASSAAAKEA